jgi:hypothetical protein
VLDPLQEVVEVFAALPILQQLHGRCGIAAEHILRGRRELDEVRYTLRSAEAVCNANGGWVMGVSEGGGVKI